MQSILFVITGFCVGFSDNEHPIRVNWRKAESDHTQGDLTFKIVRDSRVPFAGSNPNSVEQRQWRVRLDTTNIRVDGIQQWIESATGLPARVPDRMAEIEFGRDIGGGFQNPVSQFESRTLSVVLSRKARWPIGLRELDKLLIYSFMFTLQPESSVLDRLRFDRREYSVSRVTGPASDYEVVQDMDGDTIIREIWCDPANRHRIVRVVEFMHGLPSIQWDCEYSDSSTTPFRWTVLRLEGPVITDFATAERTQVSFDQPIPEETFILSKAELAGETTKASVDKPNSLRCWWAYAALGLGLVVTVGMGAVVVRKFRSSRRTNTS